MCQQAHIGGKMVGGSTKKIGRKGDSRTYPFYAFYAMLPTLSLYTYSKMENGVIFVFISGIFMAQLYDNGTKLESFKTNQCLDVFLASFAIYQCVLVCRHIQVYFLWKKKNVCKTCS